MNKNHGVIIGYFLFIIGVVLSFVLFFMDVRQNFWDQLIYHPVLSLSSFFLCIIGIIITVKSIYDVTEEIKKEEDDDNDLKK